MSTGDLVPMDFVYIGRRLIDTGVAGVGIQLIQENGSLSVTKIFDWKPVYARWAVGGIYAGPSSATLRFSDSPRQSSSECGTKTIRSSCGGRKTMTLK